MSIDNLKTWPERIWLQHGEEEIPHFDARYLGVEDMTWCQDKMDGADVEYVRADRITELERQNAELFDTLKSRLMQIANARVEKWERLGNASMSERAKADAVTAHGLLCDAIKSITAPHQQSDEKEG